MSQRNVRSEKGEELELKETKNNNAQKRLSAILSGRLNIMRVCNSACSSGTGKVIVLCDQVLDSFIVAGITGVSAYIYTGQDASLKAAILSFLLMFLIKMKEYRKIS
jgi:hypothetical protein